MEAVGIYIYAHGLLRVKRYSKEVISNSRLKRILGIGRISYVEVNMCSHLFQHTTRNFLFTGVVYVSIRGLTRSINVAGCYL